MQKNMTLAQSNLLIEWTPQAVGHYLTRNSIDVHDLLQPNKQQNKKLSKDLFLLATRAAISHNEEEQRYAVLLSHYARSIQKMISNGKLQHGRKTMTDKPNKQEVETVSLDGLQARLFQLMTQYSLHPCRHVADRIVQSLTRLCQHPHIELMPAQRSIYSQSINLWRSRLLQQNGDLSSQVH